MPSSHARKRALGWRFDQAAEEKTRRDLLQKAVDQNFKVSFKRNRDPLDPFLDALRRAKMELPLIDEVQVDIGDQTLPFEGVFKSYLDLQTRHRFYTFDDMIYLAVRILLNDDALRHEYQGPFEYVLVDEFQDLNRAQLLLLQIFALPENNLFVVGGDDQMIYGWRGAEVRHILDFPRRFAVSQDCTLSTNYRSSKEIIRHSRWLIDHNFKSGVGRDIFAYVTVILIPDDAEPADFRRVLRRPNKYLTN